MRRVGTGLRALMSGLVFQGNERLQKFASPPSPDLDHIEEVSSH
jgi:hypothetical protein